MRNRSRTEIVRMILDSVMSGNTQTKIMYEAFLSCDQVMKYVIYMTKNDLISYDKPRRLYTMTEKGRKYIFAYDKLCEMVNPIGKYKNLINIKYDTNEKIILNKKELDLGKRLIAK